MDLLITLIIGFCIGAVAKFIMPGKAPHGCIVTSLLGILGAWVGQQILGTLGVARPIGFLGSVVGAMIVLFVYQMFRKD